MSPVSSARLTLVTAPACHLCEHGRTVVRSVAADLGIEVEEVDWSSPRGATLVAAGAPALPPALFLGDDLLQCGRISEGRLRRVLATVTA